MNKIVQIEGWAAIYNEPDLNGDVVLPGAFAASLASVKVGDVRMLYQHAVEMPIGRWTKFEERRRGLYAQGEILLASENGLEAYTLVRARALDGLSIGYQTRRAQTVKGARHISAADLWEVSIVTFPMAPAARITSVGVPKDEVPELCSRLYAEADAPHSTDALFATTLRRAGDVLAGAR